MSEGVELALSEGVARIRLCRPEVKNAFDRDTWAALERAVEGARRSTARVVVIEGAGGVFSAGGDLKTMGTRLALPYEERRAQLTSDAQVIRAIVEMDRPTVALIDGAAMGAGLAVALACDVRLASARSRLSCAFRKVGVAGDFGISWLLPRLVGRGRALDLLYTGDALDAERACAMGLVERVLPDDRYAEESARYVQLLAEGPASLALIRRAVDECASVGLSEAIALEAGRQAEASRTQDAREGVNAFLEKRAAKFSGQ